MDIRGLNATVEMSGVVYQEVSPTGVSEYMLCFQDAHSGRVAVRLSTDDLLSLMQAIATTLGKNIGEVTKCS